MFAPSLLPSLPPKGELGSARVRPSLPECVIRHHLVIPHPVSSVLQEKSE